MSRHQRLDEIKDGIQNEEAGIQERRGLRWGEKLIMPEQTAVAGDVLEELEDQKAQPEIEGRVANQEQDLARRKLEERELADHHFSDEPRPQR